MKWLVCTVLHCYWALRRSLDTLPRVLGAGSTLLTSHWGLATPCLWGIQGLTQCVCGQAGNGCQTTWTVAGVTHANGISCAASSIDKPHGPSFPCSLPRFTIALDPGSAAFTQVSGPATRPTPSTVKFGFMAPVTVTLAKAARVRVTIEAVDDAGFYEVQVHTGDVSDPTGCRFGAEPR
jgi:hypothetical protein